MSESRNPNEEQGLRHQLTAGQMAMVAVGGSIGTGLFLGSAPALHLAGPAVIISFVFAAFINLTVALALGELACAHPAAGSFGVYGDLYLNEWAGFLSRSGYWAAIAFSVGGEMVASATYMAYWFPKVAPIVWVALFSVLLLLVNLRSVSSYGRFEFWFAMVKVVTIAAFVALGTALLLTGRSAPQYTAQGGFFPRGYFAPLLAMTFSMYAFGGVEFVAVTSGESRSPNQTAKAVRITFAMLVAGLRIRIDRGTRTYVGIVLSSLNAGVGVSSTAGLSVRLSGRCEAHEGRCRNCNQKPLHSFVVSFN